jgi:hypothetical protein
VLANPEEVKNRKGHKTDRKDAEHLADLLKFSTVWCVRDTVTRLIADVHAGRFNPRFLPCWQIS